MLPARLKRHIATFGAVINVILNAGKAAEKSATGCGILQVKPGIGDTIWHLPFIRAIAAAAPGGHVTFLAPPSTHARELLAAEPGVAETVYFDHSGSELRRGINLVRLVALLRRRGLKTVWILDRTIRPALAAMLAGIPVRVGLGLGPQTRFITNRGIDPGHFHDQPIDWLRALLADMKVPLASSEPNLLIPQQTLAAVAEKFRACARPWLTLGLGASHPDKDWPDAYWEEFLALARRYAAGTIFLVGGAMNSARAQKFIAATAGAPAVNACDLQVMEAAALLRFADLFVGPSSGPLNLAAAGGTVAFGLFGSTPVLTYSQHIHAIEPADGPMPGGMRRIVPAQVIDRITPYLARAKARET